MCGLSVNAYSCEQNHTKCILRSANTTVHVTINKLLQLTILITHVCTLRLLPRCYLCLVVNPLLH